MRKFFIYLYVSLAFATSLFGQLSVTPVNPKSLGDYPDIRDFTTHGEEAYFSAQSPLGEVSAILMMKTKGNKWSKPELAPFSGKYQDIEPFLSPNGLTLYFASNRPKGNGESKDFDIWFVTRKSIESDWSAPQNMGEPINSAFNEFYPIITDSKNFYFTSDARGSEGGDDIVVSKWTDGKYEEPISLGKAINTAGYEFNAYVAPDESYLIFTGYNREDGQGSGDLYISFLEDGKWGPAINLGDQINSEHMDYCPFVYGQSLYYTSRRKAITVPANGFSSLKEFLSEINQYENGQSRIYEVSAFNIDQYK